MAFAYDFGARMYDSRLGRWLSVDPLAVKYPRETPYSAFRDSPILFVDIDGKEWVNAYDALVIKSEKALLDNPSSKKIARELKKLKENQAEVNEIINNLKKNDEALYNYVHNLSVLDAKTKDKINVKVTVGLGYETDKSESTNQARTRYKNKTSAGKYKYIEYKGLEGMYDITFAPLNKVDEVGFDVVLYSTYDYADEYLANEAGDIMFRMEYPDASLNSGPDSGKSYEEYIKKGSSGDYSFKVQYLYQDRKKEKKKTGKQAEANPYPLKK